MTLGRYASDAGIEICSIRMRRLRKDYGKYSVNFPCVNIVNPPLFPVECIIIIMKLKLMI